MNWSVSTSQIDLLNTCEARWGFSYISKKKEPQAATAKFGNELHEIGEAFLTDGKAPDELTKAGNLFVYGLPYLPPPGVGGVEGSFKFELAGIRYSVRIDYRGPLPARANFMGEGRDVERVTLDHKTAGDPKADHCMPDCRGRGQHSKADRDKWLTNSQPVLYGTYDMLQAGDNKTNLRWLYYRTKGSPMSLPCDIVLARAELEDCFEAVVHNPATRILELISSQPDPNTLDKNTGSCKKYGKVCPNHPTVGGDCIITKTQSIVGALSTIRKKETMSQKTALELIREKRAAKAGGAVAAAPKQDPINPPEKDGEDTAEVVQEEAAPAPKARAARAPKDVVLEATTDPDAELGRAVRLVIAAGGTITFAAGKA